MNGAKPIDESIISKPRPIRSYVIRSGRLTISQRKAITDHWQAYVIDFQPEVLNLDNIFQRHAPVVLEIGFGMGDSLLEMATAHPANDYIGVEVHKPGIGKLLQGTAQHGLTNLKVINHDAKEVLAHNLKEASLAKIQIFFPDPWHKKKHNKRRLIQAELVDLAASRLEPEGEIHLATDWQPYAEHMMEVLENNSVLENLAGKHCFSPADDRPITKFEKRGKKLGHGVWDLRFRKAC